VILVAGGLVGEGELRPDRDALADARSSDQEKRAFAFLTPGVHVVEPEICRISLVSMGVRRLFSRGGAKIFHGGQEYTFCLKNNKIMLFLSKNPKTYYFWTAKAGQGGGAISPLAPLRTPVLVRIEPWIYLCTWLYRL
jgi:hypothetical protein